jgi:hypothetical protein
MHKTVILRTIVFKLLGTGITTFSIMDAGSNDMSIYFPEN